MEVNAVLRAITTVPPIRERSVVRLSVTPSTKCSCSGSPPILANGSTTIERRGVADFSGAVAGAGFGCGLRRRRAHRASEIGSAMFAERVGPRSVTAKIGSSFDLLIGLLREADRSGLTEPFQAGGDIDAVAHEIAVGLLDNIAQMNADAKFDATLRWKAGIALDHRPLDFNGAVHRVDDTPELDNCAIAGALDDPAVVHGDDRVDQVAAQRPQPRQNPVFVGSGKPRIADHVRTPRSATDFARFPHGATPPRPCQPFRVVRAKPLRGIAKTREECRSLA